MRKKTEIAINCLIALARESNNIKAKDLSRKYELPPAFTAKTLQELAQQHFCKSTKGPAGGFICINPESIHLCDVMVAFGEDPFKFSLIGEKARKSAFHYRSAITITQLAKERKFV